MINIWKISIYFLIRKINLEHEKIIFVSLKKIAKQGLGLYKDLRRINIESLSSEENIKPLKIVGFVKYFNEGTKYQ